jgi:hypothetical protein
MKLTRPRKSATVTKPAPMPSEIPADAAEDVRAPSFAATVASLEVGECTSRSWRVPGGMTIEEMREWLPNAKALFRRNSQPAVVQAKKRTGGQYEMESGEFVAQSGNLYVVIVVTRTA